LRLSPSLAADHTANARARVAPSRRPPLRVHRIAALSFSSISRLSSLPFTPSHPPSLRRTFNLPPFSLLSLSPFFSFSHVRTRSRARAYGLFSCFYAPLVFSLPKYNWRYDAPVSLSLSTPPALLPPTPLGRAAASSGEKDRAEPLAHSASLVSANALDACRQLANSRLPQTGSANRPISRMILMAGLNLGLWCNGPTAAQLLSAIIIKMHLLRAECKNARLFIRRVVLSCCCRKIDTLRSSRRDEHHDFLLMKFLVDLALLYIINISNVYRNSYHRLSADVIGIVSIKRKNDFCVYDWLTLSVKFWLELIGELASVNSLPFIDFHAHGRIDKSLLRGQELAQLCKQRLCSLKRTKESDRWTNRVFARALTLGPFFSLFTRYRVYRLLYTCNLSWAQKPCFSRRGSKRVQKWITVINSAFPFRYRSLSFASYEYATLQTSDKWWHSYEVKLLFLRWIAVRCNTEYIYKLLSLLELIFRFWRKTEKEKLRRKSYVFLSKNSETFNKSIDVHLGTQNMF